MKTLEMSAFLTGKTFRFCGGEPTIHPEITRMMDIVLSEQFYVFIMTNGIWPDTFANYIRNLPLPSFIKINYLFNVLEPSFYKGDQFKRINSHLEMLIPQQITLGITLYKDNFAFDYLLDLAKCYGIKNIRWSVAAPNINDNLYTLEPKFGKVAERLYELYMACVDLGINITGDCNYIQPCFYNQNHLNDIFIQTKKPFTFSCSESSPIDIDANGMAWRCYGLYSVLRKNINSFKNEEELEKYFTRRVRLLDSLYAYQECQSCKYWHQGCNGGCYVFRIKKALKQNPSLVLFPVDDDSKILNCRPYKDKDVIIEEKDNSTVLHYNDKHIICPDKTTLSFLKEIDGVKTVADLIALWKNDYTSSESARESIIQKCRELFDQDMIRINYDYPVQPERRPCSNE